MSSTEGRSQFRPSTEGRFIPSIFQSSTILSSQGSEYFRPPTPLISVQPTTMPILPFSQSLPTNREQIPFG
jgi:hypothetical protein